MIRCQDCYYVLTTFILGGGVLYIGSMSPLLSKNDTGDHDDFEQ